MDKKEIKPIFETSEEILPVIFTNEQSQKLAEIKPNIEKSFNTVTLWRTPTLLKVSVLNDMNHPTPDSKYWQLVNEMYAHSTGLATLLLEIEEKLIDLDELEEKIDKETDKFELRRLDVRLRRVKYELMNMQKTADARLKELDNQNKVMEELKEHLQFGTENQDLHQLFAFTFAWTNEVLNITEHTQIESRNNIISRWDKCMKEIALIPSTKPEYNNFYEEFINSLSPRQRQKLIDLNLIEVKENGNPVSGSSTE